MCLLRGGWNFAFLQPVTSAFSSARERKMTISRLILPLAAMLAIGAPWLPSSGFGTSTASAEGDHGGSGGSGTRGGATGPVGGGVITSGRGGGVSGGATGGAVAGRIGATPFGGAAPASNGFSGSSSGSSGITAAARSMGNNDPQSAFLGSAVALQFADFRNGGKVDLVSSFKDKDGHACREYRETVTIGGSPAAATGKVCQIADGSWTLTD
jgi:surface antigen